MIELTDVHKRYHDGDVVNHVLRGVTMTVDDGELVALQGASGSGKSTLLNVIGALDKRYEGRVSVAGHELGAMNDKQLSRFRNRTVSFVFQLFHLLPHLPVLHNVMMPSWFDPERSDADLEGKARDVLDRVGLAHKADAKANHLSGGEKQRVAVARAIFNDPKILLCDEPTGALDTDNGKRVMEVLRQLNEEDGITVLVVTHDPLVAQGCHRVIRIRDGLIEDAPEAATGGAEAEA